MDDHAHVSDGETSARQAKSALLQALCMSGIGGGPQEDGNDVHSGTGSVETVHPVEARRSGVRNEELLSTNLLLMG